MKSQEIKLTNNLSCAVDLCRWWKPPPRPD